MSNGLPMALLRPSCAALRPSAPVTQQWNSVTRAFTRSFCSRNSNPRRPLLSALQPQSHKSSDSPRRSFSATPLSHAKVEDGAPSNDARIAAGALQAKKRQVKIGPLPNGAPAKVIADIFGPNIPHGDGYNVLRILHHRRTSGSLVDYGVDNLGARYTDVTHDQAVQALEWLRKVYPIDEARAAEEWAEREANRIAYELWLAQPENADSKYNDPARVYKEQQQAIEEQKQEEEADQKIGMLRVGPSQFERNILQKRKERLEAAAKAAEEKEAKEREMEEKLATGEYVRTPTGKQLMKPGQETYIDLFGNEQVSRRKEELEKFRKKSQLEYKTPEELLSATTLTQRLYPMSAFVFLLCLAMYGMTQFYEPPSPEYRLFPDLSLRTATIGALVVANVAICALWRFGPAWPYLTRFFLHVPAHPRFFQAFGNIFSHAEYEHLISNMLFLMLVGSACHDLVGRGIFMGTFLSAGAVGTLASLYWANLGRGNILAHSCGASAAIWGIAVLYCLLTETETIKIPFVKDKEVGFYPKMLLAAFVALEIKNATRKAKVTKMDHASHFGGMAVGLVAAGYLRATGFHDRRKEVEGGGEKTLDVGKMIKEEVEEVKEGVKEGVKKIVKE